MEHLTYQQVLADHYEETAKTVLVVAHEYEEEQIPPHEKTEHEELENQFAQYVGGEFSVWNRI
jgi:hypothetical protein